jgi:D-alanine-D-alanine ligase-like ATP-grasp enzyme
VPNSRLINEKDSLKVVLNKMTEAHLSFPVIVKPDIGERGFKVELVHNEDELQQYLATNKDTYIIQEYIDLPIEAGIFYYRLPDEDKGTVSSVVLKGLLTVVGDGKSSINDLMMDNERARLQIKRLQEVSVIDLAKIPEKNEKVMLEPIGNHNRGTVFLDGNYLINQKLIDIIDRISKNIDEFYYGRYDVRCQDEEALYRGEFKIMELNGSASEPAHIYAPGFPLLKAYQVLFHHWRILFKISRINHKNGVPYMSFKTGWGALQKSRFARS